MIEVVGKGNISAKVLADSISHDVRLTTLELYYPRFIHAEFMTHRMFSRNASSSRAIPVTRMMKQVTSNPAMPIHWGKNQPGMQARKELDYDEISECYDAWMTATFEASRYTSVLYAIGAHKQIVNRITEPFQFIKVVCSATEWNNFFALRLHEDAQPEIYELARVMKEVMDSSQPKPLQRREYHLPYITDEERADSLYTISDLIECSVARCARVSYNNHDGSACDVESDLKLHDLLRAHRHMSPFEHVATPRDHAASNPKGGTHYDMQGNFWSGNFREFIQYRKLVEARS